MESKRDKIARLERYIADIQKKAAEFGVTIFYQERGFSSNPLPFVSSTYIVNYNAQKNPTHKNTLEYYNEERRYLKLLARVTGVEATYRKIAEDAGRNPDGYLTYLKADLDKSEVAMKDLEDLEESKKALDRIRGTV
jgi:hypothetical protein